MPNLKAAKKALRQSEKHQKRNLATKKELKGLIKDFKKLADKDPKKALEILSVVFKKADKAAKHNVIARNKADRIKSRLSKKVSAK